MQMEYGCVPQGWEMPTSQELKYCRLRLRACPQTRTQTWRASTTTVSIIYCAVFIKYTENRSEGNYFMRKFTADLCHAKNICSNYETQP